MRALTSAIVVAISVVDIGRRRRRPSSRPSTSRPLSWPSQLLTSAVVDFGHRHGCRLKCEFGAGVFLRLDTFEYVLVSLSKVMVPISEVNVTHWFYL